MKFVYRKARTQDVPRIYELLKTLAGQGLMLPRSRSNLYDFLQTFWVAEPAERPGLAVGMAALHVAWEGLGEIRSLGVEAAFRGAGLGGQLVARAEREALELGLNEIFSLTYIPGYFKRLGYAELDKNRLPHKIWADCLRCVHFPDCREIAVGKTIAAGPHSLISGGRAASPAGAAGRGHE